MKKGQICEGIVENVGFPNKASVITKELNDIGEEQEFRVIVKGAITGQKVKYIVKKVRKNEGQGRLLEVIEKSSLETEKPVCKQFGMCGGCNYQSLPYKEQLNLKKEQVLTLIDNALRECRGDEKESGFSYPIQDIKNTKFSKVFKKRYIYDGIISSPKVCGYRNKMEFSFGDEYKGGPLALGLHKKGSTYDIVNASGCQIVHDDYSKIIDCVKEYFSERKIVHYNKNTHIGVLRHLLIRRAESTKELLVALVTTSQMEISENVEELGTKLGKLKLEGEITGFIHIINDGLGDVVKSDENNIIFGRDWITEEILGLKFRISLFSFFQTNTKGAELLYERVREYVLGKFSSVSKSALIDNEINNDSENQICNCNLVTDGDMLLDTDDESKYDNETCDKSIHDKKVFDKGICDKSIYDKKVFDNGICDKSNYNKDTYDKKVFAEHAFDLHDKTVFDLYSGTGTIAQIIAPVVKKVIGVEIVEEAVEAARKNAKENGLDNCEFIVGDVLKVLDSIEERPDLIILDPPRDGINPKALRKIIDFGVDRIVYISCKPTSLARDLIVFEEKGYRLERVSNVDLFPNTVHVECVVLMSRVEK